MEGLPGSHQRHRRIEHSVGEAGIVAPAARSFALRSLNIRFARLTFASLMLASAATKGADGGTLSRRHPLHRRIEHSVRETPFVVVPARYLDQPPGNLSHPGIACPPRD